ncbi:uncharacterized protein, partial [Cherax quadricarinatus]|uniref:uncharacterized protein n=1 Tax=Cherax quadricarinatus TaxID=27406 RepID=UPI00387EC685
MALPNNKPLKKIILTLALFTLMVTLLVVQETGGPTDEQWSATDTQTQLLQRLLGPLAYDDADLLRIIRRMYLTPPSLRPYALMRHQTHTLASRYNSFYTIDPSYVPLQKLILEVFAGVTEGFFVEAGALDGEFLSNTLELELRQRWTGLLVEADGDMFRHLLRRHRKAWACHCCLAPRPHPHRAIFMKYSATGDPDLGLGMFARGHGVLASHEEVSPVKLVGGKVQYALPQYESVQCLPLASLLLALNISRVDFVSLDVEGAEKDILEAFPWGRIAVDAWLVEHITGDVDSGPPRSHRND